MVILRYRSIKWSRMVLSIATGALPDVSCRNCAGQSGTDPCRGANFENFLKTHSRGELDAGLKDSHSARLVCWRANDGGSKLFFSRWPGKTAAESPSSF